MKRVVISAVCATCAFAQAIVQFVTPVPPVMPTWLVPYRGVYVENRQRGQMVQSNYTAAAAAHDVLAHFRTLFASAGLPFQPSPMGGGFLIHASAAECDLDITIRRRDPDTTVDVTCSPRLASTERIENEHAQSRAERAANDPMKRFDAPVYPEAKGPARPLMWPSWLVRVDGAKLAVEKLPGQLRSSFFSTPPRESVQVYYANLLGAHGFHVTQGLAAVPEKFGSWVQGSAAADGEPGRRLVIWIKIKPDQRDFRVELSVQ